MDVQPVATVPLESQLRQLITCFDELYRRLILKRPPAAVSDQELSQQEFRAVMMLGRKGTIIMSDLARVLNFALSTATNIMDKLVGKELVERTRVDADRRIVQVALSKKGQRLYDSFLECQLAMGRTMLEALSPGEAEIFLELMAKMTQPAQAASQPETEHSVASH
jgi:DNA-binding MarR family transcriptional regulator